MIKKRKQLIRKEKWLAAVIFGLFIIRVIYTHGYSQKEVKIIIYQNGKEVVIKQESPFFSQLQKKVEDCFIYRDGALFLGISDDDIEQIKDSFAIEIIYPEIREFNALNEKYKNKNYSMKTQKLLMPLEYNRDLSPGMRPPLGSIITGEEKSYHSGPTVNQNGMAIKNRIRKLIAEYLDSQKKK